jgi:tRNA-splicing ligase RtcB
MKEMQFCVDFALANRTLMMNKIIGCFDQVLKKDIVGKYKMINIAHNYAAPETHFGREVIVHRKGATSARAGETGIVPGSQGTKSYIVEGLGNPESFMSCSHGAGRRLGRNQAIKTLNLKEEIDLMNRKGIIHGIRSPKDLDEAAGAYKDIDLVMENQKDLVKILVELKPMAVVKG